MENNLKNNVCVYMYNSINLLWTWNLVSQLYFNKTYILRGIKGHKGTFWGNGNILLLDSSDGFMSNSSKSILKRICLLHINCISINLTTKNDLSFLSRGRKCLVNFYWRMGCPHSSVGKESAGDAGDPSLTPVWGSSPGEGTGYPVQYSWASLVAQLVKNPPVRRETWVQCLGLGRSPGERKGYPLQYSGLENSMDYTVHGITKSQTWPSNFHWNIAALQCSVPFYCTKWIGCLN